MVVLLRGRMSGLVLAKGKGGEGAGRMGRVEGEGVRSGNKLAGGVNGGGVQRGLFAHLRSISSSDLRSSCFKGCVTLERPSRICFVVSGPIMVYSSEPVHAASAGYRTSSLAHLSASAMWGPRGKR